MRRVQEALRRAAGFARNLACNMAGALVLAAFRRRSLDAWRVNGSQLVALFVLAIGAGLVYDIYVAWPGPGRVDWQALPTASFWALPLLLGSWLIAQLGRSEHPEGTVVGALSVSGFALAAVASCATTALAILADFYAPLDRSYQWLSWVPVLWTALAWGASAPFAVSASGWRALAAVALAAAALAGPQWSGDAGTRLWVASDADTNGADNRPAAGDEQILYGQSDLLEDALDRIAPGRPGVTELYSITFAGAASQDVFLNEALGVNEIMADLFDTSDRSVVLANNQKRPGEAPFATVTALQRALATMAERMDEDDVLFLFLTSHGSPDHALEVSLPPYQLEAMTPQRLRSLLDESGIRFRIIVVSACYSGGFIPALSDPYTMVITASGADRTSFGCRDGEQWTDFGRAYFKEALPTTGSFEGALQRARELVAQRESAAKLPPSEPQIFVGDAIRQHLQTLQTPKLGSRMLVQAGARRNSSSTGPRSLNIADLTT